MSNSMLWSRFQSRYQRTVTGLVFRRTIKMSNRVPYISFTFDDFPCSALHVGGGILSQFGLRGTYYASIGLMGTETPTGRMFVAEDLTKLLMQGHELGCHTFSHCHSWETNSLVFEDSIIRNRDALVKLVPGAEFESLAYPISGPRLGTKRRAAKHFRCCRGGGQSFNEGMVDLNLLNAFFLEKSRHDSGPIKEMIKQNSQACGWLIFGTHDISETPTPFGCTPAFFEEIVKFSVQSGARILPVSKSLTSICQDLKGG